MITKQELIDFEEQIKQDFLASKIRHPIHLSKGNEDALLEVFKDIKSDDWVFSNHRSHFHALLKGIPKEWLREQIHRGNSMHIMNPEYKFFAGAIVAGCTPIAVGVAMAIKRKGLKEHVWAFIGDMAAESGIFHECQKYASNFDLPITFVIEDNGLSTNSPSDVCWNHLSNWSHLSHIPEIRADYENVIYYSYERDCPHIGVGSFVEFK